MLFTSEDGLLSDSTTAITQSADGFIWIGGYSGLTRYDGHSFRPYEVGQISSISALQSTSDGSVWIASADTGLTRYQEDTFTAVTTGSGEELRDITCLNANTNDALWYGSNHGIGSIDSQGNAQPLDSPRLNSQVIRQVLCISASRVLAVTRNGELYYYDGGSATKIDLGQDDGHIRCIARDEITDRYYVGTDENHVLQLSRHFKLLNTITVKDLNTINALKCDESGSLWIAADDGVSVYKNGSQRRQHLKMDNSIEDILIDSGGDFWFISSRQGVLEVASSRFGNVSQSAGLNDMVVNALLADGKRLYVGHDEGFLILNRDTYRRIEDKDYDILDGVRIRNLYMDQDGCLWVCTKGMGLLCHTRSGEWEQYSSGEYPVLASDNFRCLYETGGRIIAGTDEGAYVISHGKVSNLVKDPDQISCRILSITQRDNITYLGTDGNGLLLIRDGKVIQSLSREDGLTSNVIMKMYPSWSTGGIWLVTGKNLAYLDPRQQVRPIRSFLSANNLDFLLLDNGDVLIPCGTGIYETTEESLLHNSPVQEVLYGSRDGLPYEVTANSNQYIDLDVLYLCGTGGIIRLDRTHPEEDPVSIPLYIDEITVDGVSHYFSDLSAGYEIPADAQRVGLATHALTYQAEEPYIFYYLEGFESEPNIVKRSDLNEITYTNLDGGDYTFHYGLADPLTGSPLDEIRLPLHKNLHWYETLPARLLGILLLLLLLGIGAYQIIRVRTRRLREQFTRTEREHLQRIAYHDYLTDVYNRNYLEVWTEEHLPLARWPISFVTLDCNGLKRLNDEHGHLAGDRLLKEVASLLLEEFSRDDATVIRTGGDEFLILLMGMDEEESHQHMQEISRKASGRQVEGHPVSFSYGICTMDENQFSLDQGVTLSDLKMLQAKSEYYRKNGAPDRRKAYCRV
ncbi:MAG: diguanylate cyclase [Firmicutes bacterium]|nr:diguanylate cyclase [Bacillota bacterium]